MSAATVESRVQPGRLGAVLGRFDSSTVATIVGLVVISGIFQSLNSNFLTSRNFVNLLIQGSAMACIAMGVVFVLLLGEIDMSAGYVSGVGAAVMALLMAPGAGPSWPWWLAVPTALLTGLLIGSFHGLVIAKVRIPSFIVTLAGFLAWNGVVLWLVGSRGSIGIQNTVVTGLTSERLPGWATWALVLLVLAAWPALRLWRRGKRLAAGLEGDSVAAVLVQTAIVAAAVLALTWFAVSGPGVPYVLVLVGALLAVALFVLNQTRFGVWVYAVGGNAEAARRAGIRVARVQITCFAICSMLASLGGMILASRLRAVDSNTGGGSLLLYSIAAAVIGGTSLFGGRGGATSAIKGALVIAAIDNGLGLLGLGSAQKFIITGIVLLLAVVVDAVARDRRGQMGRA